MNAVAVDETILLTDRQCFAMVDWVAVRPWGGRVLGAFLASIALAALGPMEALALRVRDLELHDEGRDVLLIHPQGQLGQAGGADGTGAVRRVPACPELVAILKAEIVRRDLGPDHAVFTRNGGRPLTGAVYRRAWRQARAAVLEPDDVDWRLGRNVSDLRVACIAAWLRNGDQTAGHIKGVAECVGISAPRLAERFSYCLQKRLKPSEIPWDQFGVDMPLPGPQAESTSAASR